MATVLITGAGRGLGLLLVKRHLDRGDIVFAAYRTPSSELEEVEGDNLVNLQMDVGSKKSVDTACDFIKSKTDHLDIIYHNAGVFNRDNECSFVDSDLEDCPRVFNVNAVGFLRVSQALWNLIGVDTMLCCITSDAGSMQFIYDKEFIEGKSRYPNYAYRMSKAAMNMAAITLKEPLRLKGAKIILIHPGWMQTNMGGPLATDNPEINVDGVVALATGQKEASNMYMDFQGNPMPW